MRCLYLYWKIVGQKVTKAILSNLNSGKILNSVNHTFITLILKVQNPMKVIEFHPISLCNVSYKLISIVLANRLKKSFLQLYRNLKEPLSQEDSSQILFCTTKNTICRGGFFRGSLLNRLYRQLLRRFS